MPDRTYSPVYRVRGALALSLALASVGSLGLTSACSPRRPYTWVHDLPGEPAGSSDYVLRVGDIVSIRVLDHENVATRVRVREDGRVAVPMLGEIDVAGRKPAALRSELEARLKDFFVAPSVTLNVEEQQPVTVSVIGEVSRPAVVPLSRAATVPEALAMAGGLTEFADHDGIYVVRSLDGAAGAKAAAAGPKVHRIRFTYEALSRGEPKATTFTLKAGDLVVVE